MPKCRGYADIEKNIFKKDLIMERKDGLIENKMRNIGRIAFEKPIREEINRLRQIMIREMLSNSANLKPE